MTPSSANASNQMKLIFLPLYTVCDMLQTACTNTANQISSSFSGDMLTEFQYIFVAQATNNHFAP